MTKDRAARRSGTQGPATHSPPRSVVLVTNIASGPGRKRLERATELMTRDGVDIIGTLSLDKLDEIRRWIQTDAASQPMIVAAGGDGTVGAVVDQIANTGTVLGIVPLGTSNDVARSLRIPSSPRKAAKLLTRGKVSTVDLGLFIGEDGSNRHFAHVAAAGLNVKFARMATQASWRKRFGRLKYVIAGVVAWRHREPFHCELNLDGTPVDASLLHLSITNAPVFGGILGLRLSDSNVDDRVLDVLLVEEIPLARLVTGALRILLRRPLPQNGFRVYRARDITIRSASPIEVSLDGEVAGSAPCQFRVVAEGLSVVTPVDFEDIDD